MSKKKNKISVPKLDRELSNDLYSARKGRAKRKRSIRTMKKIIAERKKDKQLETELNDVSQEEEELDETTEDEK